MLKLVTYYTVLVMYGCFAFQKRSIQTFKKQIKSGCAVKLEPSRQYDTSYAKSIKMYQQNEMKTRNRCEYMQLINFQQTYKIFKGEKKTLSEKMSTIYPLEKRQECPPPPHAIQHKRIQGRKQTTTLKPRLQNLQEKAQDGIFVVLRIDVFQVNYKGIDYKTLKQ